MFFHVALVMIELFGFSLFLLGHLFSFSSSTNKIKKRIPVTREYLYRNSWSELPSGLPLSGKISNGS